MLPKESPTKLAPHHQKAEEQQAGRGITNWHWLIKHPVEFSKNNRYPANRSGALQLLYPALSVSPNPGRCPNFTGTERFRHHKLQQKELWPRTAQRFTLLVLRGFPQDGRARAPEESRSLARLPGGSQNITPRSAARQIDPPWRASRRPPPHAGSEQRDLQQTARSPPDQRFCATPGQPSRPRTGLPASADAAHPRT